MTNPVVLTGPASPAWLSERLGPQDSRRALELPGLGGTVVTNLVKAFLDAGRHVELVTLAPELKSEEVILEGPRLRILVAPFRRRPRHHGADAFRQERRHVRKLLSKTSGRVVHAFWTYEFALGATRLHGRATVVTAQDAPFTVLRYASPRAYRALRAAMAVALRLQNPLLTVPSPYLAGAWRRQMFYRGHIWVVPNVVPLVATGNTANAPKRADSTIFEAADAGTLKNVKTLVRAMPEIVAFCPSARLQLAGRGLTRESTLARFAQRLGIDDCVEFIGRVGPDVLDSIYREATIFVHASREESFGMSVAEAMSYELPVVGGGHSGAVPWLLDDGRAGLLVNVRKPTEIANGVIKLLADPSLRRQLAVAGGARARTHFSPRVVTDAYLEVYAQAEVMAT